VTANYTIRPQDPDIIEVTTGASNITITLPALNTNIRLEPQVHKVDSGAGVVTVQRAGSDTITRAALTSVTLTSQGDYWKFAALSSRWELTAGHESTSGADGWIKYYDGKMEEWISETISSLAVTTASGSNYKSANTTINWTQTFTSLEHFNITLNTGASANNNSFIGRTYGTTSLIGFIIMASASYTANVPLIVTANGRWYT
jgi:hypothetical protein